MAFASANAFGVAFNAYTNLALTPTSPPRLAKSLARGHQPRADVEISSVSQSVLLQHIDAVMLWTPLFPGASPGFHPPEGGKAVRLRVPVIVRRFAGFAALAPGLAIEAFLCFAQSHHSFRHRCFAGLSYLPGPVDSGAQPPSSPAPPAAPVALTVQPTPVLLRHGQPSQGARVTRFPLVPRCGLSPHFPISRVSRHFLRPPVSCSHTLIGQMRPIPWTEANGLLLLAQGLPACLVLAPCMQLSLHTAPTSRFPRLAIRGVEAGGLRAHYALKRNEWLCGWDGGPVSLLHRRPIRGRQGPPQGASAALRSPVVRMYCRCIEQYETLPTHLHLM